MNYKKIGDFISSKRKEKKLTQAKLAEKIFVSEKTISKWENGNGIPDTNSLIKLCEVFNISLNELLAGEKMANEHNPQNEKLLFDMAKELETKNKIIWKSMWIIMIVGIITLSSASILIAYYIPEGLWQILAMVVLCAGFFFLCFYALKLEVSVGTYKCKNCGCEIIPTYKEVLWSKHMGTTRHLKCPTCKKRTWCKKCIKK